MANKTGSGNPPEWTYRICVAVAERSGVDVHELPPLYDAVDPEAIGAFLESGDQTPETAVEFSYAGYRVSVDATGHVDLDQQPGQPPRSRSSTHAD